ncbi:MAG: HAMP domain-containing sensor histidine kinase [Steroidobacteraceae bacterium]
MRPLLQSSASRLAFLYVLSVMLSVGALLASVYLITQRAMESQVDLVIQTEIDTLRDQYETGGLAGLTMMLRRSVDNWGRTGAVYLLADEEGLPVAGNLSSWPDETPDAGQWLEFVIDAQEHGVQVDHPVRARVFNLGTYRLLVGTDVTERQRLVRRMRSAGLWGIALSALLAAAIGWWYTRRVASRVRVVAQTCEGIISGDLARRLPVDRNRDEFDQLALAVNHMLDRIEQQTLAVRTTFDSAAHDLRSPLHRIRVRVEGALHRVQREPETHEALAATLDDLERMQRTLATLLQIAQADAGVRNQQESVDLAELAREMGDLFEPEARARGLAISVDLQVSFDQPARVTGNRQLLAQLIANLLENALKYGGTGLLGISVRSNESRVVLEVSDQGPGIPEERRAEMLLPFRRLERDETLAGSGLGLSLVATVVRMCGAQLTLGDNAPGLKVRCEFPRRLEE